MTAENLQAMFARADDIDRREGQLSYSRYLALMNDLAFHYGFPVERVVAAFVSLSPNSDYEGNLRSTVTLMQGVNVGKPLHQITSSSYRHCLERAHSYLTGEKDFVTNTAGLKILNFYHNILNPNDSRWVTIDGHINAIWLGRPLTMKQAILRTRSDYDTIAFAIKHLAFQECLLPNQYQAILWFTRKRVLNRRYDAQLDLLCDPWKVYRRVMDIQPYR